MIDALFNVAVFAMLVLCIVGFGSWTHKRVSVTLSLRGHQLKKIVLAENGQARREPGPDEPVRFDVWRALPLGGGCHHEVRKSSAHDANAVNRIPDIRL
jgi:hypothetical protein